jgi:dipeptidyl aminopeptidase/acylaminoacyl peptidase
MKRLTLLFPSAIFFFFSFAQNGKDPVHVTDMLKIKTISSVVLNSDGSQAAFTVTSIEPEENNKWEYKYVTHLWLASTEGASSPRQLTFAKEGGQQPAWSPDSKKIAFVRFVEGKPQIFILSLDGGEPVQLTKHKYGAFSPRWSADGKQLLFSSNIPLKDLLTDSALNPNKEIPKWNFEKPGFANNENLKENKAKANPDGSIEEVRAYLDNNEKDKKAKVINKLQFQEEATTSSDMSFTHIFIIDADPKATPRPLTRGFNAFFNPQFIAGTDEIIMEADVTDTDHPDRTLETQVYSIKTDGSGLKKILGKKDYTYNNILVSPSGKQLALLHGSTGFVTINSLGIMPVNGSEKDIVTIPFDRNKGAMAWSEDEKFLWFTSQSNGGVTLNRLNLATKKIDQLTDFNSGMGSFAVKNNKIAFVKTEVANPFELYAANTDLKNPVRISSFNHDWVKEKKLSFPEKHEFKNEKGLTVEYWVMKPTNYEAGKKFPIVLEIHGGPSAMWGPGENTMWHEFQFWCSKGYGVVYSNPRGSGGYGLNFLRANINDWGQGPMNDVLNALNRAVAEGWADTSKLAVTGGSYAGYLIGYILGHDKRFKAACSQRGVYDLRTFFGEANAWRLVPNYFGGYPWEKKTLDILERESPINYVQNISTPYIIFHGENDLRTGVSQSEQMYKSLKVLNKPVEYVRHPGATHEITRSGNNRQRIDQMLRTWEFFERWIRR